MKIKQKTLVICNNDLVSIDNGTIHLHLDLSRGGAITYISKSGINRNIINTYDNGRYIQQSYYAGNDADRRLEGQSANWPSWCWNPIQAGDTFGNKPKLLDFKKSNNDPSYKKCIFKKLNINTIYTKCNPLLFVMNNMPSEAIMEQTTTLDSNVIKVTNKITCNRTDTIYGEGIYRNQEMPAVYPISALNNLYSYKGNAPYTNAPLTKLKVSQSPEPWGEFCDDVLPERWLAFVDDDNFGIGIYNPNCNTFAAGLSGQVGGESNSESTNYIAPIKSVALNKKSVFEYTYYLIIGNLEEIRLKINKLHKFKI